MAALWYISFVLQFLFWHSRFCCFHFWQWTIANCNQFCNSQHICLLMVFAYLGLTNSYLLESCKRNSSNSFWASVRTSLYANECICLCRQPVCSCAAAGTSKPLLQWMCSTSSKGNIFTGLVFNHVDSGVTFWTVCRMYWVLQCCK